MTVEAAVVVPMVIFILAAVIYLSFFLHDRAVLQSYSLRQAESTAWEKDRWKVADKCAGCTWKQKARQCICIRLNENKGSGNGDRGKMAVREGDVCGAGQLYSG